MCEDHCVDEEMGLLTAAEVAAILEVAVVTVNRWAREAAIRVIRLPGGGVRFHRGYVERIKSHGIDDADMWWSARLSKGVAS